jgi:hypothetical protein
MSRLRVAFIGLLLAPAAASAGELELGVFAGRAFPTYEQTFDYNPGAFHYPIPYPGLSIAEQGAFGLTAKGGLAAGASLAFFPVDAIGIEARFDTLGINVDATGVSYVATVTLQPLPPFTASLALPPGIATVDRLTPLSFGLKLRTPGRVRLSLSVGGSHLPKVGATVTQSLAVGLSRFSPPIDVTRASVRAAALPGEGQGKWGVTAAVGLKVPLAATVSFQMEARAFRFQKQTLGWELVEPVAVPFIDDFLKNAVSQLDPVEFNPTLYQVTAGIALRF